MKQATGNRQPGVWVSEGARRARRLIADWLVSVFKTFACLIVVAAACVAAPREAHAQFSKDGGHITDEDSRRYAALFWSYKDTGIVPAGMSDFRCSDGKKLGENAEPFFDALMLFSDVYGHRLVETGEPATTYSIWDLLRDDPIVLARFRQYTLTGVLESSATVDSFPVLVRHAELISIALTEVQLDAECVFVDTVSIARTGNGDLSLASTGLKINKELCGPPLPPFDPSIERIPDELERILDEIRILPKDPEKKLYDDTNKFPNSDFDCDDFADAEAEALRKALGPEASINILGVSWEDGGHALVQLKYEGRWYIVDPQTNERRGPLNGMDERERAAYDIMERSPDYGFFVPPASRRRSRKVWEPGTRPNMQEGPSFWTDPDMRKHFRERAKDPERYLPPGTPPPPPETPQP